MRAEQHAANGMRAEPTPCLSQLVWVGDTLADTAGVRAAIPMGRVDDVSGCVVFLAPRLSSYVTGTTLHPDGGTYASSGWFNWRGQGWANHVPAGMLERDEAQG